MISGTSRKTLAALFLLVILLAPAVSAQEQRHLVRFDRGTASLDPNTALRIYISPARIKVFSGKELVHEIPARHVTLLTRELRAPFDPPRTTERVLHDTVGSCMDLTCAPVSAAGLVGAVGVGVASLFTPKEMIVNIHWVEEEQPRELGIKLAWYQRDIVLGQLEGAAGRKALERDAVTPADVARGMERPVIRTPGATDDAFAPLSILDVERLEAQQEQGTLRWFEWQNSLEVRVGATRLAPGTYIVLIQEMTTRQADIAFLDTLAPQPGSLAIRARASATAIEGGNAQGTRMVFTPRDGNLVLAEIRLESHTLRLAP